MFFETPEREEKLNSLSCIIMFNSHLKKWARSNECFKRERNSTLQLISENLGRNKILILAIWSVYCSVYRNDYRLFLFNTCFTAVTAIWARSSSLWWASASSDGRSPLSNKHRNITRMLLWSYWRSITSTVSKTLRCSEYTEGYRWLVLFFPLELITL